MHYTMPKLRGKRQTVKRTYICIFKNNFTEQLTDDEDGDSTPFLREPVSDVNKQPLKPQIYHSPSPQEAFAPVLQTERNQNQRGNEENAFLLKDLFQISLKAALIKESEDLICSYDVHKEMQKRKLRSIKVLKSIVSETFAADHAGHSNFQSSAIKIEAVGATRIFQRFTVKRGLKYAHYYGDVDSKDFISVKDTYGKDNVTKYECKGHDQKKVDTRLKKLKSKN
ncbi:uncharacterized protein TNCV_2012481 [Trichonephila clavipes]|nr:uncharacterized protein TNCV_2012481 [Trichonephila clavipes]